VAVSEALLGVVAGLRSALPLALLVRTAERDGTLARLPAPVRRGPGARYLALAALGELVVDKLPQTGSRIEPERLGGRVAAGAVVGAAAARRAGRPMVPGAVLGAAGAVAGSYAGYRLRKAVVERTSLPDPFVALGEDALALGLGSLAVRRRA
jgi:uncharacterized membrane protein